MSRQGFAAPLALIGLVVIALLFVGAYYAGQKQTPNRPIAIPSSTPSLIQPIQSPTLTPTPTPTPVWAKRLTYRLPSGWKTIQDASGTFEIGYDPNKYRISGNDSLASLSITTSAVQQFGGYYIVRIDPYDGGSRHAFILNGSTQDLFPKGYHETSYILSGMSCLVLYGVSISQWPGVEGMCAIDNTRAFRFALPQMSDPTAEQIISTIKLLK